MVCAVSFVIQFRLYTSSVLSEFLFNPVFGSSNDNPAVDFNNYITWQCEAEGCNIFWNDFFTSLNILHLDGVLCFVNNFSLDPCETVMRTFYNFDFQSHKFMPEYVLWSDHCSTDKDLMDGDVQKTWKNSMFLSTSFPSSIFPVFNFDGV